MWHDSGTTPCLNRYLQRGASGRLVGVTTEQLALIVSDPNVMHGQVCIKGTRIPVSVVLDCLAAGMTEAGILQEYPTLSIEGIRAAAAYGAALARDELLPLAAAE